MAINIEWQFEDGSPRQRYTGPDIGRLQACDVSDSCCLRFLDPYGDLTLNAAQTIVLESELKRVIALSADLVVREQAAALLQFVGELDVEDRTHHYLKFIGD
jgi:hypothetical protein